MLYHQLLLHVARGIYLIGDSNELIMNQFVCDVSVSSVEVRPRVYFSFCASVVLACLVADTVLLKG